MLALLTDVWFWFKFVMVFLALYVANAIGPVAFAAAFAIILGGAIWLDVRLLRKWLDN
ncbi:MAG: hypothetical protein GDA50_04245 [Alphaproteobacteria bacterium GM202ARS2]|nr:hypothetical protein [Alphaproteobacteria bacterium GM202ARS2]